jgi:hypothetical protein
MPKTLSRTHTEKSAETARVAAGDGHPNGLIENGGMAALPVQAADAMQSSSEVFSRMAVSGQELSRFAAARLGKDVSVMTALATCRSPQQFSEIWFGHLSETARDYADEFERIRAISLNS